MKMMSPQGKYCDLACYPICQGYRHEGCLMFNEERSFFTMKMILIAEGVDIRNVPVHAGGLWLENCEVRLSKNTQPNVYVDEPLQ